MKKYEIEINDEIYRVAVKELPADADMSANKVSNTKEIKTEEISEETVSSQGTEVKAPMPGTILSINVSSGQSVLQGDVLAILEAMKMENEIIAPTDGVINEILITTNDSVKSDQVLFTL